MNTIYSTLNHLHDLGLADGMERGTAEGACRQLGKLLLRHGKRTFGPPCDEHRLLLDGLIEREGLPGLRQAMERVVSAGSWAELLAGLSVPETRPEAPAW